MRRVPAFTLSVAACVGAAVLNPSPARSESESATRESPAATAEISLADHHVHVFSPAVAHWLETELNLAPLPSFGSRELIAALDRDRVTRAAVLSNAYFFGHDTVRQSRDESLLTAENDRVAELIVQYPGRLVGFFGIDPLADSALEEIERCARRRVFAGLKLHLANAAVDLRNPAHVQRLSEVFRRANALGLAVVIHMRTLRSDYGREDAQIFIDKVLSAAPDVPVQIAHLGGWGGYDVATDDALSVFIERANKIGSGKDRVYFDLSAVVRGVGRNAEGSAAKAGVPDWWPEKRYVRLAERLRALGIRHVLFGTDWPDWTPRSYAADIEKNVPLSAAELRVLLTNRAPWLR